MENLNEKFYSQFIQLLKETIPERGELSKTLSDILSIEKMSVYRRLKGEIPFTFAEIITIARQLNISVDNLIRITSPDTSLHFSLHLQDYFNLSEADYEVCENYIKAVKAASESSYSEFGFAADILPRPVIVFYQPIFRFFMMKWMYQFGDPGKILSYSEIHIPKRLSAIHKEFIKDISKIKYSYFIFHEFAMMKLMHDIQYFKAIRLLTKEDIDLLKESLYDALRLLEKFSINGYGSAGNKIDMFVSGVSFETSYSYLMSEKIHVSRMGAYILETVSSSDLKVCETMKKWMQSIKRTSTIITNSEKNRIEYIEKQKRFLAEI